MHPTLPLLLSSSDDMLIKLWDWDKVAPQSARLQPHACCLQPSCTHLGTSLHPRLPGD